MQWNIIGLLYKKVTTLARCLIAMTLITMCRASVTSTWLDKTSTFQQVRAHIFICDTTQMCPIHLRYVNVDRATRIRAVWNYTFCHALLDTARSPFTAPPVIWMSSLCNCSLAITLLICSWVTFNYTDKRVSVNHQKVVKQWLNIAI